MQFPQQLFTASSFSPDVSKKKGFSHPSDCSGTFIWLLVVYPFCIYHTPSFHILWHKVISPFSMQQSDPQNLPEPGQDASTPITTCVAKCGRSWWLPGQGSLPSPVLCTWMAAAEGQGGRGSIALVLPERSARLLTASCSPPVVLIIHTKTTVCWQGLWLEAKADEDLRLRHNEWNRFHHGTAACT
jgi:hypothetical protein